MKRLRENKKLLMIVGVLVLVVIALGLTYAFFSYSKSGSTENSIKSGSITFWYDEINQSGNSISIEDALPMSDEQGKQQTQAFNFKIVSTTAQTISIPYEITLRQKSGTDDIGDVVKVYLAKTTGYDAAVNTETEVKTSLFSALPDTTHNGYSEKVLHNDGVPAESSNYEQYYRLKMWVDENTDYSDGTLNNKTFTVMVNVYANGQVAATSAVHSLSIGGNELTQTGANEYETTVPVGTTSTTVNIETIDADDTVEITKTESDYTTPVATSGEIQRLSNTVTKTVNVTIGYNHFKIVVKGKDNQSKGEIHLRIAVPSVLRSQILSDNELITAAPTLTGHSTDCVQVSSNNYDCTEIDVHGLYKASVTNGFGGANGDTYYFRGAVENNKVILGKWADGVYYGYHEDGSGALKVYRSMYECQNAPDYNTGCKKVHAAGEDIQWRIVRINEDGTIRLILDGITDGVTHSFNANENDKNTYYSNSKIKADVETWFNRTFSSTEKSKVATGNYFCEAAKIVYGSTYNSSTNTITYKDLKEYTPSFSCPNDSNNKGVLNNKVGLITFDEVMFAGGFPMTHKYNNYYLQDLLKWWTMTPAIEWTLMQIYDENDNFVVSDIKSTIHTTYLSVLSLSTSHEGENYRLRPVINLKSDTVATKDANGVYVIN